MAKIDLKIAGSLDSSDIQPLKVVDDNQEVIANTPSSKSKVVYALVIEHLTKEEMKFLNTSYLSKLCTTLRHQIYRFAKWSISFILFYIKFMLGIFSYLIPSIQIHSFQRRVPTPSVSGETTVNPKEQPFVYNAKHLTLDSVLDHLGEIGPVFDFLGDVFTYIHNHLIRRRSN